MIDRDRNREILRMLVDPTVDEWVKRVIVRFFDLHPEYLYDELREEIEINGDRYRAKFYEPEHESED